MNDEFEEKEPSYKEKIAEAGIGQLLTEVKDAAKPILDTLKGGIRGLQKWLNEEKSRFGIGQNLQYEEVMKYFIAHKDDKPEIVKGALMKENVEGGYLITQVFLDKDNKLVDGELGRPIGCKRKVAQLDKELLDLFTDNDLIIVE
jgi:hypothetical protein